MDSPRGRIYLIKMAAEGKAEMTPQWVGHFDACLGCMACMTACPSGVDYGKLIEATRAQIERKPVRGRGRAIVAAIYFCFVHEAGNVAGDAVAFAGVSDDWLARLCARSRFAASVAEEIAEHGGIAADVACAGDAWRR